MITRNMHARLLSRIQVCQKWFDERPGFSRWLFWVAMLGVAAVLVLMLYVLLHSRYAWGAWGDDSPGYQFLAARLFVGIPLIWNDGLASSALAFFGNVDQAQWILPMHHEFIHPNGTIASKYPTGASLFLAVGAWLTNSVVGMYWTHPFLGGVSVLLTFVLALLLFRHRRPWNGLIGALAALMMMFSPQFLTTALGQPMREIPSIAVTLASLCMFVVTVQRLRIQKRFDLWSGFGMTLAGLLYGLACTVRETSIMFLPAFVVYGIMMVLDYSHGIKAAFVKQWRVLSIAAVAFGIAAAIGLSPIVYNSFKISQLNEPFKERDTGEVVLLSNIDHLQTVSLRNVFHSEGRYRPDSGSLPTYWNVMQEMTKIPFFVWLAIAGLAVLLFQRKSHASRSAGVVLALATLGTLTIFSLWINPYSRYILPVLPMLSILAAVGIVEIGQWVIKPRFGVWVGVLWILAWSMVVIAVAQDEWVMQKRLRAAHIIEQRGISQDDSKLLVSLGKQILIRSTEQVTDQNTIVLFTGQWRMGLDEVFWAQSGIRGARLPLEPFENTAQNVDPDSLETYIDQLQKNGVRVYVWIGATPVPVVAEFLDRYKKDTVLNHGFSFMPSATLIELLPKTQ